MLSEFCNFLVIVSIFFKNVFIGKTNYFPCIVLHTENEFPSCAISKSNYCFQVLSLVFWNVNFIFDCLIFSFFSFFCIH